MSKKKFVFFSTLIFLALASVIIGISFGSYHFSISQLFATLTGHGDSLQQQIILQLRLPQAINSFTVGGLLALAGALLQVLLRNPLADPYILGVSGGAAVATLLSMLVGLNLFWQNSLAFAGALCAILLVYLLAYRHKQWSVTRLLLTGVVLAAGWGALISFILTVSPDQQLRGMLFWLIGNLTNSEFSVWGLIILATGLLIAYFFARELNLLLLGDLKARSLGVNTTHLNTLIFLLSSLLTATAVAIGGTIGFIGLIIPHMIRLLGGGDHRILLPASVLLGGTFLCLSETLAKNMLSPQQLPVGIITAFIGVPVFLVLLQKELL